MTMTLMVGSRFNAISVLIRRDSREHSFSFPPSLPIYLPCPLPHLSLFVHAHVLRKSHVRAQQEGSSLLAKNRISWCLDLELPIFQTHEK